MTLSKSENIFLSKTKKLVDNLQNENKYPIKYKMPVALQFELTANCNMRCVHCYNRSGDVDKKTLMKLNDWLNLSKHLIENGGIFQCVISGGEPLLMGDGLYQIMDILASDNTAFVFITNGYLLDEKIVDRLKKYRFYWVQISIDGDVPEYHDTFRNKKGSWERAVIAATLIANAGIPLTIASAVTPHNIGRMNEMAMLSYRMGASSILFGEVMLSGRASENRDILLNTEQKVLLKDNVEKIKKNMESKLIIEIGATDEYQMHLTKIFPTEAVIIRPDGSVRLDCTVPFVIGNVLEKPFSDIWEEKSSDIWSHEEVVKYIRSVSSTGYNDSFVNHVNDDIRI